VIQIKAQISTEYLVIAGLVILIAIPLTYIYIKYTTESNYAVVSAKVSSIANEISKLANQAYVYGEGTQLTVDLDFPSGIESITFSGDKDIVFKIFNKQGDVVDIVKQAEVNLFSYGTIPITPGKKRLIAKSLGNKVLVQIPCIETLLQTKCVAQTSYSYLCPSTPGKSYCLIQCQNSAWAYLSSCTNLDCSPGPTTCT